MDINNIASEPKEQTASRTSIEEFEERADMEGADITDQQIDDLSGGLKKFPIKKRRD